MWTWMLAYRNLGRNRRRSLATGAAITAGFVGLVLISSYLYRAQRALEVSTVYLNHKGHLSFFKRGSLDRFIHKPTDYLISKDEQNKISGFLETLKNEIDFTGRYLSGMGLVINGTKSTPFVATGVEPDAYRKILNHNQITIWTPDWVFPETVQTAGKLSINPKLISLTQQMGDMIGKSVPFDAFSSDERYIQLIGKNYFGDLNVVDAELGLRHTTGMAIAEDTSLYTSLAKLQELYATEGIQYWAVFLKDPGKLKALQKQIQTWLDQQKLDIDVIPFNNQVWGSYYVGTMSFLNVIAIFFIVLICGAVVLSVFNTTTLGIYERNTEIGTLRATGFNPKSIYALFWKENFILSLISLSIGYIVAEGIAFLVNAANIKFRPPGTQGDIQFVLISQARYTICLALLVLTINFISTLIAVRKTTKMSIVNLLASSRG